MSFVRIPYKVCYCSSEDDNYSPKELETPGPECKGWRSEKYSPYPQNIVIQLETRSTIDRIQIMIHQYMIPSLMVIELGDVDPNSNNVQFKKAKFIRLGEVEWNKNGGSGRQLQTIELSGKIQGSFLRFNLFENYVFKNNDYNQVSIMAINILGFPSTGLAKRMPQHEDIAFLMYTDPKIASIIQKLDDRRFEALDSGHEDHAEKLRNTIHDLETEGIELGVIGMKKRMALESKDEDKAKSKNKILSEEREEILKKYDIDSLLLFNGYLVANDQQLNRGSEELPPANKYKSKPKTRVPVRTKNIIKKSEIPRRSPDIENNDIEEKTRTPTPDEFDYKSPILKARSSAPLRRPSVDERQIKPLRRGSDPGTRFDPQEEEDIKAIPFKDQKELSIAIKVFGAKIIKNALHKQPSNKNVACQNIKQKIEEYDGENNSIKPPKFFKGSTQIVSRLIREKVWQIYSNAINMHQLLMKEFLDKNEQKIIKKDIEPSVMKFYNELIIRCGDTNERVSDKAEDAIKLMLKNPKTRTYDLQSIIIKPLESKEPPKQALTKAELVFFMITKLDLQFKSPVSIKHLSYFGLGAIEHPLAPVRKQGEKILKKLHEIDPTSVRSVMPQDTPKTRKNNIPLRTLFEEFDRREAKRASLE